MYYSSLLSLPPAVLLLLCATASCAEPQWPHNVPKHLQYFPEDEVHAKRGLEVKERLKHERPIGVKKMSVDEGEMFMLDNWIFASDNESRSESNKYGNDTFQAISPLRPLVEEDFFARIRIRAALSKRQFACPSGTSSCSSIGAPDVCCSTESTCISVENSPGVGSVGCCPRGQRCAGSISCDTANGFSSCPDAPNGGCCLPGFRCNGIGCKYNCYSYVYGILIPSRRCCRHVHNIRTAFILSSATAVLHSRNNRAHHDLRHSYTHTYHFVNIRIHLLNRILFLRS
jgi:hypothetical protein